MTLETSTPSATGGGLIEFLDFAIAKGYLNASTGQAMKSAVREVLSSTHGDDEWESFDLTSFDADDLLQRFETLRAMKYSPSSLTTYKSRFAKAVAMFAEFRASPSTWRPKVKPRSRRKIATADAPPNGGPSEPNSAATPPSQTADAVAARSSSSLIRYPFPLRPGVLASIDLPPDLSHDEARRLAAFVESLAIADPQHPARQERTSSNE